MEKSREKCSKRVKESPIKSINRKQMSLVYESNHTYLSIKAN